MSRVQIVLTDIVLRKSEMINQLTTIDTRISDQDLISLFLLFYTQYIHSTSHTIFEIRLGNLPYEFNELLNDSDDFEHGHW